MKPKSNEKNTEKSDGKSNFDQARAEIKPLIKPKTMQDKFPKEQFETLKNLSNIKK